MPSPSEFVTEPTTPTLDQPAQPVEKTQSSEPVIEPTYMQLGDRAFYLVTNGATENFINTGDLVNIIDDRQAKLGHQLDGYAAPASLWVEAVSDDEPYDPYPVDKYTEWAYDLRKILEKFHELERPSIEEMEAYPEDALHLKDMLAVVQTELENADFTDSLAVVRWRLDQQFPDEKNTTEVEEVQDEVVTELESVTPKKLSDESMEKVASGLDTLASTLLPLINDERRQAVVHAQLTGSMPKAMSDLAVDALRRYGVDKELSDAQISDFAEAVKEMTTILNPVLVKPRLFTFLDALHGNAPRKMHETTVRLLDGLVNGNENERRQQSPMDKAVEWVVSRPIAAKLWNKFKK